MIELDIDKIHGRGLIRGSRWWRRFRLWWVDHSEREAMKEYETLEAECRRLREYVIQCEQEKSHLLYKLTGRGSGV